MPNESPSQTKDTARAAGKPVRRCPICSRPSADDVRPFCSPRCRDVDLHRWLAGAYVIPGREGEEDEVE